MTARFDTRRCSRAGLFLLVVAVVGGEARAGGSTIAETRHNLSVSGPGPIRAVSETEICVFCHTPHTQESVVPLWNREQPKGPFLRYESSALDAVVDSEAWVPTGASRLCMSCHDGTLALGAVQSRKSEIALKGATRGRIPDRSPANLGLDLRGSHPVSIRVTEDLVVRNNSKDSPLEPLSAMKKDPDVHLDGDDEIQCTTCHDPHDDSNYETSGIHFFKKQSFSDVCKTCHRL